MPRLSATHVTVVLVAALLCLGLPAATVAAGVSKVALVGKAGGAVAVSGGRLAVDPGQVTATVQGTVPTTVAGTVTTEPGDPADYVHDFVLGINQHAGCARVLQAPATSRVLLTSVEVDTVALGATGEDNGFLLYAGATCQSPIAAVTPATVGVTHLDFGPGLVLAPGASLWVVATGSVGGNFFGYGMRI